MRICFNIAKWNQPKWDSDGSKYFFRTYCLPDTVPRTGTTAVTDKNLCPCVSYILILFMKPFPWARNYAKCFTDVISSFVTIITLTIETLRHGMIKLCSWSSRGANGWAPIQMQTVCLHSYWPCISVQWSWVIEHHNDASMNKGSYSLTRQCYLFKLLVYCR